MDESENHRLATNNGFRQSSVDDVGTPPEIREAVLAKLEPIVGHLQPAQEMRLVEETMSLAVQISGPIPPAIVLKGINDIVPGAAERIIKMAETDQQHSHAMDRRQLTFPFVYQVIGLVSGALITVVAIAGAVYCAVNGQPWLGGGLFGGTLVSVVGVLVRGAWSQTKATPPPTNKPKTQAKKRRR